VPRLAGASDEPEPETHTQQVARARPRRISPVDLLVPPRADPLSPNHPVYAGRREQARSYGADAAPDVAAPNVPAPAGLGAPPPAQGPDPRHAAAAATGPPEPAQVRRTTPREELMTGTTDRAAERDGVRPGRRATVPSWDEILFGARRQSD
jgi:hypothetical protein